MLHLRNFTGKDVVVLASGVTYEGRLVEMNESSILLKSAVGFREIPLETVVRMDLKDAVAAAPAGLRSVSPLAGLPPRKD